MQIKPGHILISTPFLNDTVFEQTVLLISEHNQKGTIGFVFNQLYPRSLNELVEFKDSIPVPLYAGGPVDTEHLFMLHCRPDLIPDSEHICDHIYRYGDFKQAVQLLNNGELKIEDVRLFIGYCGWDEQQLEGEVAEGSWLMTNADANMVFTADTAQLWEKLLAENKVL